MEQLLLGALGLSDKRNIVDHENICRAELSAEGLLAVALDGSDEFVGEGFRRSIDDLCAGISFQNAVADGMHQWVFPRPTPP